MKTKRKVFILLIGLFLTFLSFVSTSKAEVLTGWGKFGSDPENIAKTVAELANDETSTRVQDTKLDGITNITAGSVSHQYQISNTLIRLSNNENGIMPYIQWTLYIGLVGATILLIWNGFLLVTGKKLKDAQENIKYILLGVIIMTGFYAIIEVISAILNFFFS